MRDVLFGEGDSGKSYAVLCQDEESTAPISSVFSDAFKDGSAPAHFRLLDCNYVLPSSGKSIADRFKIDLTVRPTVFVSGAGVAEPQQIPSKHLKTGDMLVKALRSKLEARAAKIETTQELRSKCLDKDICGLLLKGSKKAPKALKDAMTELLKEFPNVPFAAVDTSVLYVKNLEDLLPELKGDESRFVVFKKISGSTKSGGRLITSMATLEPGTAVSYGTMSNLVAGVVRKTITPSKLATLPQIKSRTKKLLQEEKAKRERKQEQQRRQQEKQEEASTGGGSTDNDGSREGRRAERDRRRAEHRAKNNVREKTPEEIAEMERKRRERMAEEAAKWNMAPEDAPPTGDPMYEGETFEEYSDETEGGDTVVVEDDDDDSEEVIDLD